MKIVIPGGSGQLGGLLKRALAARSHEVVVLSRGQAADALRWDGQSLGPWTEVIDGADAVINLAGRSVNCRYNKHNLTQMQASRVDSTAVVGQAIAAAARPPRVWLQMSTATIYAHRFDGDNDERNGLIGGPATDPPGTPVYWRASVEIAKAWERALDDADTPRTRKVALRSAMVMSPEQGGVFDILRKLVRLRLGGTIAGGQQYMSWIHADDFVAAIELLLTRDELSGAINLAAPQPLAQHAFMAALREAWGAGFGLPAARWMVEVGAFFQRSDSELLLKSRRVVPGRLLEAGFRFRYPCWPEAAAALVATWRDES